MKRHSSIWRERDAGLSDIFWDNEAPVNTGSSATYFVSHYVGLLHQNNGGTKCSLLSMLFLKGYTRIWKEMLAHHESAINIGLEISAFTHSLHLSGISEIYKFYLPVLLAYLWYIVMGVKIYKFEKPLTCCTHHHSWLRMKNWEFRKHVIHILRQIMICIPYIQ